MRIALIPMLCAVCAATPADAASVSFNVADTGVADTLLSVFPAGVEPSSNWTQGRGVQSSAWGFSDLIDDTGTPTTLDMSGAGFTLSTFNTIPSNTIHRYGDSHFPGAAADTWTLSEIPYAKYKIIVYVSGNNLVQGSVSDGSTTFYFDDAANKADAANLIEITDTDAAGTPVFGTYAVFGSDLAPLSGSSQTISWDATGGAGAAILNGFQVVEVIVPMPATSAMALIGLAALGVRRRRG